MIYLVVYFYSVDQVDCMRIWGDIDGVYFTDEKEAAAVAKKLTKESKRGTGYAVLEIPQYGRSDESGRNLSKVSETDGRENNPGEVVAQTGNAIPETL
jgi:hypothetical protein